MAVEIRMPKLSDTMTEGSFIGWRKNVGERIERGDVIAEVETDKAVMELEAFASGVLLKTMAKGGENVPVGTVLGLIGEPGEQVQEAGQPAQPTATAPSPAEPMTEPSPTAAPKPVHPDEPLVETPPVQPASTPPSIPESGNIKASPMVRHMALERGINLADIRGSGPDGRILQEDLLAATAGRPEHRQVPAPEPEQPVAGSATATAASVAPASGMRQAIAATVIRSWQEIPQFSVTVEIGMEACREIVTELKKGDKRVGYQSLVIKACSVALREFPLLLPEVAGNAPINIGFAVALPDEGLLVPVIRDCQRRSPAEIEAEAVRLAERSRAGRLTADEFSGGHFSISNLGMFGVEHFNALIVPGQMGVLALGSVAERPVARSGRVEVAVIMEATLSADHRAVDGAYAARFLARLREILEQPLTLLV